MASRNTIFAERWKKLLDHFKKLLDQKWKHCSSGILEQSVIVEDVSAQLVQYIQQGFHKSALDHFQQSIYFRLIQTGIAHWFISQLVKRLSRAHSSGTKLMFEIASQASDFKAEGIQWKEEKTTHVLKEEKLCFQVNHSFLLENILELVFTD